MFLMIYYHDRQAQIVFFYLDSSKMPLKRDDYTDISYVNLSTFFDKMLNTAKVLCEDIPFVRVFFLQAVGITFLNLHLRQVYV